MPLEKLSRDEVSGLRSGGTSSGLVIAEYAAFLRTLPIGDGGRGTTESEGVSRAQIKNRIRAASAASAVQVKFLRPVADNEVVFEVVDAANAPKRRGRKPKNAGA